MNRNSVVAIVVIALVVIAGVSYFYYKEGIGTNDVAQVYAPNAKLPFTHPLTRIVSLLPSITVNLYALGAEKDLVGISTYTSYPRNLSLPIVGELDTVNYEELLNVSPQAVITIPSYYPQNVITKILDMGIPVIEVGQNNFTQIEQQILELGNITGTQANASKIVNWMQTSLVYLHQNATRLSDGKRMSIFYLLSTEGGYWTAGNQTFINDFFNIANLRNIVNGTGYYTVPGSLILNDSPDIVLLDQYVNSSVMKTAPFDGTNAYKNGTYFTIFDDNYFNEPDFRSVYAVQWLIDEVYNTTVSIPAFPIQLADNPAPSIQ
ncbi:ABC transporter substrate-binding protein [Thermoplasma sp. Kam2015]|uniref:ABC transporter substrate-binding protein n=1 Tax=Thermoplasma sp. Kam2015 TaxID=2094122 RepID=UPI001F27D69E|nr:ABC transporter substrate-binding protein [Thermoplasma sp. Kam2015]